MFGEVRKAFFVEKYLWASARTQEFLLNECCISTLFI